MDITEKIDGLIGEQAIAPLYKELNKVVDKNKGWTYENERHKQIFLYQLGQPGSFETYTQIEIPYFADILSGKKVQAWIGRYSGVDLDTPDYKKIDSSTDRSIIYNWKGLDSVLKKEKKLADSWYKKGRAKFEKEKKEARKKTHPKGILSV